jgi:hypothetical protein
VGLLPSNCKAKIDKLKQEKHKNISINEPEIKPRKEVYTQPPEVYVPKGPARNKFASSMGHRARNTSLSTVTDKELPSIPECAELLNMLHSRHHSYASRASSSGTRRRQNFELVLFEEIKADFVSMSLQPELCNLKFVHQKLTEDRDLILGYLISKPENGMYANALIRSIEHDIRKIEDKTKDEVDWEVLVVRILSKVEVTIERLTEGCFYADDY